jgi:hypothetical protein
MDYDPLDYISAEELERLKALIGERDEPFTLTASAAAMLMSTLDGGASDDAEG